VRYLLHHTLSQNIAALYGIQFVRSVLPLITVPYLARVLGPGGWGLIAFVQAFGRYSTLVVEYGFGISGTREVARHRDDSHTLAEFVAGVLGARLVLACTCVGFAIVVRSHVELLQRNPLYFWAGLFAAVAQAFSMTWYFQGLERMRVAATIEAAAGVLATLGIFWLVGDPASGWVVLGVNGMCSFLAAMVGLGLAYRDLPIQRPRLISVRNALRAGWAMFLFTGSVTLYTAGNSFILGLFVSPVVVGYYAGAEKIARALLALLSPVAAALYPRLSFLAKHQRMKAARLARAGVCLMGSGGVVLGVFVLCLAPQLIGLLLGPGFESAIPVLRVFSLLPPLIALSNAFGLQWMLPLGMDRAFNLIVLLAGIVNLSLAWVLAPRFGQMGMAWAVVAAELLVTIGAFSVLRLQSADPFSLAVVTEEPLPQRRLID